VIYILKKDDKEKWINRLTGWPLSSRACRASFLPQIAPSAQETTNWNSTGGGSHDAHGSALSGGVLDRLKTTAPTAQPPVNRIRASHMALFGAALKYLHRAHRATE
jgi:hypothetical protein